MVNPGAKAPGFLRVWGMGRPDVRPLRGHCALIGARMKIEGRVAGDGDPYGVIRRRGSSRGNGPPWAAARTALVGSAPARREARSASGSGYRRCSTDYHTTTDNVARKYSDATAIVHRPGSVARIYNSGLRGRRRFSIRQHPRGYGSTRVYHPPLREPSRQYNVETRSYRAPKGFQGALPLGRFLPFATFRSLTKSKSGK